ncbi:MAG: molecular chaperone TorD family protein [Polyangiaceae bacterium]|nr:molecular chaperone TorD family protein [Polyangiaceae bacterium]NUQ72116.1 molecular chaperone TorD family protein [Polyangiaceae bacterium]
MAFDQNTFDRLAVCLEYPTEETASAASQAAGESGLPSGMREALARLRDWVTRDLNEAEELYTRMFDMSPVCTLHAGYHLFGEDYQRGALLAMLRGELRAAHVDEKNDLPDFLPTLLRLLGRLEDPEDRSLLASSLLLPALEKMNHSLERGTDAFSALLKELPGILENEVVNAPLAETTKRTVRLPCLT